MNPHYALVADRANHRCEYCRAPEIVFNFPFEVEHIVPLYRGGTDEATNLALSCRACNLRKGINVRGIDPDSKTEVALFHPRQDNWNGHFQIEIELGIITGTTSTGKATVAIVEMNTTAQLTARLLWIRLGLFP